MMCSMIGVLTVTSCLELEQWKWIKDLNLETSMQSIVIGRVLIRCKQWEDYVIKIKRKKMDWKSLLIGYCIVNNSCSLTR